MISRCKGRSSFAFILYGVISLHIYFTLCIISSFFMLSCYHLYYLLIAQSDMDTTSSNKGKGVMNAFSTDGNPVDKQFKLFDGESLNQAPAPTTMPYSQSYMAPPNTFYGEPLDVAPLTVAKPGEPVDHTPSSILNHKAYKGGWKVLRYPRHDGRVDKVIVLCCHIF